MQEIVFVDSQEGLLSSRGGGGGGGRHTGTRLTVPPFGTVLGHSQGFLQCHFSRCKVGSFKGLRVRTGALGTGGAEGAAAPPVFSVGNCKLL